MRKHQIFTPLVEALQRRAGIVQQQDLGDRRNKKRTTIKSRFSDEERGLQSRVRGFDSLSALYRKCREDYMKRRLHDSRCG